MKVKRKRDRVLPIRGGFHWCVLWWITPNGVAGRWGRYILTEDTWSIKLSFSCFLSFFLSHLLTVPLSLTLFELVERFEHAVWSPRTVFEITVCSQNWDERQGSNAHKQTHRSRWRTNWEFFPYRHSWQTLSWYYLKSIRTIACSKCVAATLKTWGIVLHTGEAERGSNCQPDGKANYSLNNYCHYTFVIVNLS